MKTVTEKEIANILVHPENTIKETIEIIDRGVKQIALVVDQEGRLLGTVTDGDVRRGVIRGLDLNSKVTEIMNQEFYALSIDTPKDEILNSFKSKAINQIPLLDKKGRVKDIVLLNEIIKEQKKDNFVVLMIGGLGTRLRPLTENTPKPLLQVGDKPILETIIEQFKVYGFYRFIFCTNYEADQIREYFGQGERWGIEIKYIKEEKRLGTAGALSLIDEKIDKPFIVMNGDLLTKLNFDSMLRYHREGGYLLTIGSREYNYQIPYGVLDINENRVINLVEKPTHTVFINAGVYVLNPELIGLIPHNEYYDMTDLINQVIADDKSVGGFPIREYWLDIGQHEDYQRANWEYWSNFKEVASAGDD